MIGREGPGPERPGPDYPPEWDTEPEDHEAAADLAESAARRRAEHESAPWVDLGVGSDPWATQGPVPPPPF